MSNTMDSDMSYSTSVSQDSVILEAIASGSSWLAGASDLVVVGAKQLHVLLRHRPPSTPREGRAAGRLLEAVLYAPGVQQPAGKKRARQPHQGVLPGGAATGPQ